MNKLLHLLPNNILGFALILMFSALLASEISAVELDKKTLHPFASFGMGLAIFNGNAGQINQSYLAGDGRFAFTDTGGVYTRDFESDASWVLSLDGGVALWDIFRGGLMLSNSITFDKHYGNVIPYMPNPDYDPDADTNDEGRDDAPEFIPFGPPNPDYDPSDEYDLEDNSPTISSEQELRFHPVNLTFVGAFTGVQFELGAKTPTRHYLYFDYGLGWLNQYAGVSGYPHFKSSSISHLVRVGIDVPIANKFGTGIELSWLFPQESDIAKTFAITAKASYRF